MARSRAGNEQRWAVARKRLLRAMAAWVALAICGLGMALVLGSYLLRARSSLMGSPAFLLMLAGGAISALAAAVTVVALVRKRAAVLFLALLACAEAIVDIVGWWYAPGRLTIPGVALLAQAYALYQLARIKGVLAGHTGAEGDEGRGPA